jgi:hypothetical protein
MLRGEPMPTTTADTRYTRARQATVNRSVRQAQSAWSRLDLTDPAASWAELAPSVVAAAVQGQEYVASLAQSYVAGVVAAAGGVSNPLGRLVIRAFAGTAANGLPLLTLLSYALAYLQRMLALGMPPSQARAVGLRRLVTYVSTEITDTSRIVTQIASIVEPDIAGYERIVHLPACGRCIILAGRLYRYSTGFLRHPRCDCSMKPVTYQQWRTQHPGNTPRGLFESMSRAQQDAAFGAGDAEAIRAGADISRVVNAHRKGSLYVAGGRRNTRDAITTRGAGSPLGALSTQPGRRYRTSGTARPTAAQLVHNITNRDELINQLRRYSYIR